MKVFTKTEIEKNLPCLAVLMTELECGYIAYSLGKCIIPPVGYLPLPHGELHIKYGMLKASNYATIKVAAGSYNNDKLGLPSSSGCVMVVDTQTGFPVALLQDEGLLTNYRTSAAGALMAKKFAPDAEILGIVGCGTQGYYQALHTCQATGINRVVAYDKTIDEVANLTEKLRSADIQVERADSVEQLCRRADIITTVTPSKKAYIDASWLKPNAHINAFGCDSIGKRELCANIFENAELIMVDSYEQCINHGELQYLNENNKANVTEIGTVLLSQISPSEGLTVADFTGVAVQDIVISTMVYQNLMA
ncbi:ornithine cyclodeaminase family protein [Vibrio sp. ER1A]|uniref:ornithine cyclodeaminase family protein n=1 Tax=Vibrio sp. ER1A TaxID=1517681 RepID=UPI0004DD78CA|nr:ornithine cyclodeaminase family protein [Vibrio sp. ER1A]KFA99492.1 hypothetical protein HW45_03390 [Vibrio sp. ER1A]